MRWRCAGGPPRWSPYAVPRLDAMFNTLELFVHHEDIRRAQDGWVPRAQDPPTEDTLWRLLRLLGRGTSLAAPTGVVVRRSDRADSRHRLRQAFGRLIRRHDDRGVFVLLDRSCPTRLLAGLPEGVPVRRLGLAQVVAETRDFLSQP